VCTFSSGHNNFTAKRAMSASTTRVASCARSGNSNGNQRANRGNAIREIIIQMRFITNVNRDESSIVEQQMPAFRCRDCQLSMETAATETVSFPWRLQLQRLPASHGDCSCRDCQLQRLQLQRLSATETASYRDCQLQRLPASHGDCSYRDCQLQRLPASHGDCSYRDCQLPMETVSYRDCSYRDCKLQRLPASHGD
jgi:hypothetical protein